MKKLKGKIFAGLISATLIVGASTFMLSGCASPTGSSVQMTQEGMVLALSPDDLNRFLQRMFPIEKEQKIGKLILEKANVKSIESENKISLGVDSKYDPPLLPAVNLGIDVEGGLKYNPKDKAIYLKDPLVNAVRIFDKNFTLPSGLKPFISNVITEVFGEIPLYKFSEGNLASYLVKDVKVENGKIIVKFGL